LFFFSSAENEKGNGEGNGSQKNSHKKTGGIEKERAGKEICATKSEKVKESRGFTRGEEETQIIMYLGRAPRRSLRGVGPG
jgi:hypothetical protein